MAQIVKYRNLSEILIGSNDKNKLYEYVQTKFGLTSDSFEFYRHEVDVFVNNHNFRWLRKSKGRQNHFETQYSSWLDQEFVLKNPKIVKKKLKPYSECSDRTKKRRMESVRENTTNEEIEGAYLKNVRENSEIDAEIINKLSMASPDTKELIIKLLRGDFVHFSRYTADEALALMVDLKLTKFQYDLLHTQAKKRCADIYPPYSHVLEAKKRCYPEGIELSDYGASITVQSVVDHTCPRLIEICDANLLEGLTDSQLIIIYKWGLDGAKQNSYKMTFQDDNGNSSDEYVLMISLVPLQIRTSDGKIIWTNPNPSSPKLCRVIQFYFIKEDHDNTNQQYDMIQDQINKLNDTIVNANGKLLKIKHKLFSTMVDGKVINNLTDTSSTNCNICDAKPTEMNNYELLKTKPSNIENYCFGLSTLHCWIRFLVAVLNISYRLDLPIKKCRVSNAEEQKIVQETKTRIQETYKLQTGFYGCLI